MNQLLWPTVLLLLALTLIVLEVFVPSAGVLSAAAALAMVASIVTAFMYGGMQVGTLFMAASGILLPLLIWLMLQIWPKTPLGRRILIKPPTPDEIESPQQALRKQLVGRHGIAVTAMLPAGAIRIEGRTFDAISDGISIEKNTPIEVIAVRGRHLVVRPFRISTDEQSPNSTDAEIPDPFDDSLP